MADLAGDVEVQGWRTRIRPKQDGTYSFQIMRSGGGLFRVTRVSCSLPVGDTTVDKVESHDPEEPFDPETGEPNPMVVKRTKRIVKGGLQAHTPVKEMTKAARRIEFVYPNDFEGAKWPLPEGDHQVIWHVESDLPRPAIHHIGAGFIIVDDGEPVVRAKPQDRE